MPHEHGEQGFAVFSGHSRRWTGRRTEKALSGQLLADIRRLVRDGDKCTPVNSAMSTTGPRHGAHREVRLRLPLGPM
jgi:hypothetical protein